MVRADDIQWEASAQRKIAKNFLVRLFSQLFSIAVSLATMSMLGRYLGEAGYGEYAFWYSLIFILAMFADLGLQIIVVREVAKTPERVSLIYGDALILKSLVSLALLSLMAFVSFVCFPQPQGTWFFVVVAAAVVSVSQDVAIWVFRGLESMEYEGLLVVLSQFLWIGLMYIFVVSKQGVTLLLAAQLLASLGRTAVGFLLLSIKGIRPNLTFSYERLRDLFHHSLPVGGSLVISVIYSYLNLLLLRWMGTANDVAALNVGSNLTFGFLFLAAALTIAFFPVLSKYANEKHEALEMFYQNASKYLIVIAIPITMALVLLSGEIIALLFREGFEDSIISLRLLSFGLGIAFLNRMYRFVFPAVNRQQVYLRNEIIATGVNLGLCLLLIGPYTFVGACVALLVADIVKFWLSYHFIKDFLGRLPLMGVFVKPLSAGLVMATILVMGRSLGLLPVLALGTAAYVCALFVTRTFSSWEVAVFRRALFRV
jgi:O-antigen/teichoic acid export membrane protein